ncbi:TonB-dependent receptor [Prolixibacteraceae bacterium]|nr:TonB-dependent receptor [Prolixibacteraceae bacterium]
MKIRSILLSLLILVFILKGNAQTITGQVVDNKEAPLPLVNTFILAKSDSSYVKGVVTNSQGEFSFQLPKGDYLLRISYVGYKTQWKNIGVKGAISLEPIRLIPLEDLQEVTVMGQRRRIISQHDKVIFNVENSYASNTSANSFDLLSKAPGLIVDTNNRTINMIGKGTLIVTINGKQLNLDGDALSSYLGTINPKDIKDIEIIENPPAKYDAGGNAGVLNIVLKKKKSDFIGANLSLQARKRDRGEDYGANTSITIKRNKLSFNGAINIIRNKPDNEIFMIQEYPLNLHLIDNVQQNNNLYNRGVRSQINYDFSKTLSIGIGYSYLDKDNRKSYLGDQHISNYQNQSQSFSESYSNRYNNSDITSANIQNIYSQIDITTNKRGDLLTLQTGGVFSKNTTDGLLINNVNSPDVHALDRRNNTQNSSDFTSYAIDYSLKEVLGCEISLGTKASFNKSDGIFSTEINDGQWKIEPSSDTEFIYKEDIYASYLEMNKNWKKLYFRVGVRAEHTKTSSYELKIDSTYNNSYTRLFPNAILGYKTSSGLSFTISYNKRFTRPWIWALSPATNYTGDKYINQGNPFLKPMISDNYSFRFSHKRFIFSLGYIQDRDMFNSNVLYYDQKKDLFITSRYNNFKEDKVYLNLDYGFKVKWWSCNIGTSTNWRTNKNTDARFDIVDNEVWSTYFRINNDFRPFVNTLFKNISFNANYWYNTGDEGDRETTFSSSNLNCAINYTTSNNKLNISLSGNDLLNTQKYGFEMIQNNTKTYYKVNSDQQSVILSLSYSLGGNIKFKRKDVNNQDLKRL